MGKELSEMTLEELWALFPIILREHSERYAEDFKAERGRLFSLLAQGKIERLSHIGSTAVRGLLAKPTVDLLLEVSQDCDPASLKALLCADGWILMSDSGGCEMKFNKGYTKEGFADRVFHLHVRRLGDWGELYFRDYMIEHPAAARQYEALKRELFLKFEHNRDAYTLGKTDFVGHYTKIARELYPNRYAPHGRAFCTQKPEKA